MFVSSFIPSFGYGGGFSTDFSFGDLGLRATMNARIPSSNGATETPSVQQQDGQGVSFCSILFGESHVHSKNLTVPEFFADLNIDQIVASITAGREEYNLRPFYYTLLRSIDVVNYRYAVFRDLENKSLLQCVRLFTQEIRFMRSQLEQADKLHYKYQKLGWFRDAVEIYCNAVRRLASGLRLPWVRSRGFLALREYLTGYVKSPDFTSLVADTEKVKASLLGIRYSLHIDGNRINVTRYKSEPDFGTHVLKTFEKFNQGASREYRFTFPSRYDMNHVEAAILDLVAQLYPEVFSSLEEYSNCHRGYLSTTISTFDREVQFYIAYIDYSERLKQSGVSFCNPTVTDQSKEVSGREIFDLALAERLLHENTSLVTNDFYLRDPERIIVVSGPNQGGKTTFARTFGQLHYFASIGCPVPGREAKLFLCDQLFTHFEREEDIQNLRGKMEDDLLRIRRILESATSKSILIMNESFLSTTSNDALFLSKQIMKQIIQRDMLCVSVTFLDEIGALSESTVSMVSTVSPQDPAERTFKIVRRPADGLAYAVAIARKHRLTFDAIRRRIAERAEGGNES